MLTPLKKSAIIACLLVELEDYSHQDSVSVKMYGWTIRTDVTLDSLRVSVRVGMYYQYADITSTDYAEAKVDAKQHIADTAATLLDGVAEERRRNRNINRK